MLCLQLAIGQHKSVIHECFQLQEEQNRHCWSVAGFGSFQKASHVSHYQTETPTTSTTGSVQVPSLCNHVQTAQRQITRWFTPHSTYSILECVPLYHWQHALPKCRAHKSYNTTETAFSTPVLWTEVSDSQQLRPVCHNRKVARYSTSVLQVDNTWHKGLGKKCSLHYPQEQQTCTSHMREVEVSVAIFLEKVGFTDKVHGQCRQNLAERARTAWRWNSRTAVGKTWRSLQSSSNTCA